MRQRGKSEKKNKEKRLQSTILDVLIQIPCIENIAKIKGHGDFTADYSSVQSLPLPQMIESKEMQTKRMTKQNMYLI